MKERLQKLLAQANIGSRRASEELISKGRVRVNGAVAQLGDKADPKTDTIEVDGALLKFEAQEPVYIMLNKPKQVLSTDKPHKGDRRETVSGLLNRDEHLFSIGRLDADSEGMIVMTNDGDLAQRLSHPKYRHTKTYRVEVVGLPTAETLDKWQRGVFLEDGQTAPCFVEIVKGSPKGTVLRVVMTEGKKRQIRRVASLLGHPVRRLTRTHIGMLALGDLEPGQSRPLTAKEVMALRTPAPEIKELRATPRRRVSERDSATVEEPQDKRRAPRTRSTEPQDEPRERRRAPRAADSGDDGTKRRIIRTRTSASADDAPDKRRAPRTRATDTSAEPGAKRPVRRVRPSSSADDAPDKRRAPRTRAADTSAEPGVKRPVRRVRPSSSADDAPEKRRAPRSESSGEQPRQRRSARTTPGEAPPRRIARARAAESRSDDGTTRRIFRPRPSESSDESADAAREKRPVRRVRTSDAPDETPNQRRSPRTRGSESADAPQEKRPVRRVRKSDAPNGSSSKRRTPRTTSTESSDEKREQRRTPHAPKPGTAGGAGKKRPPKPFAPFKKHGPTGKRKPRSGKDR